MKEKYIREIEKKLPLPRQAKKEVLRDLEEAFASSLEHGETEDQVIQRLGSPEEFIASLNEQLDFEKLKKFRWQRRQLLGIGCTLILSLLCCGIYAVIKAMSIKYTLEYTSGVIGGADGPTAILVTSVGLDFSFWIAVLGIASFVTAVILGVRYILKNNKKDV